MASRRWRRGPRRRGQHIRDHGKLWADVSAFRSRGRTQSGHRAAAALRLEGTQVVTLVTVLFSQLGRCVSTCMDQRKIHVWSRSPRDIYRSQFRVRLSAPCGHAPPSYRPLSDMISRPRVGSGERKMSPVINGYGRREGDDNIDCHLPVGTGEFSKDKQTRSGRTCMSRAYMTHIDAHCGRCDNL